MSNITDVLNDEGKLANLKDLPEDVQACISEIRFAENGIAKSIKFWPKPHALHLAASGMGLSPIAFGMVLSEQARKSALEVQCDKAALSSGCKAHPASLSGATIVNGRSGAAAEAERPFCD